MMTNTPPPVAALVEALEYADLHLHSFVSHEKLPESDMLHNSAVSKLTQALKAHHQTVDDWEAVREVLIEAIMLDGTKITTNDELVLDMKTKALPQWAKDWADQQDKEKG